MNISTTDARPLFTKMLVDVYKERPQVTGFLRSFFMDKIESTKELSIEVQRGTEKIAVDVIRGSIGNRNTFGKSSEKVFIPPFHREYFDATELSLYDTLFGSTSIDDGVFTAFLEQVAEKMGMLQDKIERAHELQCAQVLLTGVVQLVNGTNIDYKRKAASLVGNTAGNTWLTDTVDPNASLKAGAEFIRTKGKGQGSVYNVILGSTALDHYLGNAIVQSRADIRNFSLDDIREPQRNSVGGVLHGQVSAGAYKFRLWSYPEYYDTKTVENVPYIDPKSIVILPEAPRFKMGFAAVPQLVTNGISARKGKFIFGDYVDERQSTHDFDVKSAGLAIPVAIDQIYTEKVVA